MINHAFLESITQLHGKRAIITGALGHIGRVFALTFAELGVNLILIDRHSQESNLNFFRTLKKMGIEVEYIFTDLELSESRSNAINLIKKKYKKIDVLVNNAAFVGDSNLEGWAVPLPDQSLTTWGRAFEVNATAIFHLTKELSFLLNNSESPAVINISSIYGQLAPNWSLYKNLKMGNPAAYGASKGAVNQLTKWFATALAPKIRVNSISPGGIYRSQPDDFVKRYKAETPLGRMASEEDLRGALIYLASNMSEYVTGQDILVDGGWSIK